MHNSYDDEYGSLYYYLYSFWNLRYSAEFSNKQDVVLYYRNIPLFSSIIECINNGKMWIVFPELWITSYYTGSYYIEGSFRYLMFQFVFAHLCKSYSKEAKIMLMRVIPVYKHEKECEEFKAYIKDKGFLYSSRYMVRHLMEDEALQRFRKTRIYMSYDDRSYRDMIFNDLEEIISNPDLVINFADPDCSSRITTYLQIGKMLVDWLKDWRNSEDENILP